MPQLCEEGGKRHLAESLWEKYKYEIRCATCPGNLGKPGFIKDQAGKATADHLGRRYWTCQRSNGQGITQRCGRVSCSELINLAKNQLEQQQFEVVFYTIWEGRMTVLKDCEALRIWAPNRTLSDQSTRPSGSDPLLIPTQSVKEEITLEGISPGQRGKTLIEESIPSHKRKGSDGLFSPLKRVEINPTSSPPSPSIQIPTPILFNPVQSLSWSKLQTIKENLTDLVKIRQGWAHDLDRITSLLQSSIQLFNPLDTPTDSPSSSYTIPESDWQQEWEKENESEISSPPEPISLYQSPSNRVEELIQEFLQIGAQKGSELSEKQQRRGLRQQARKEGLGAQFQTRLSHEQRKQLPSQ